MRKNNLRYMVCTVVFIWIITPIKTVHGQSAPITEAHLQLDSLSPATVACTFLVVVGDTNNVSPEASGEVALGASAGDTSLVFHVFDFDVMTGLPMASSFAVFTTKTQSAPKSGLHREPLRT